LQGCGISQWHLPLWEGRPWVNYPQEAGAPGYEGWGFVDALGAGVDDLELGQRVALLSGHAYAQFDMAPRDRVVPLPEELDDEPFPGEAFAVTMNVFEQSQIRPGQSVAVVGAGFVGLLLTQLAADRGAHVAVLSRHPHELELAESMDADEMIVARGDGSDTERALRVNGGAGFDRVIEVSGSQTDVDIAHRICAESGRLVIARGPGYPQPSVLCTKEPPESGVSVVDVSQQAHEHYVRGVHQAIQAALEGRLDPFPLMSHTVSMGSMDVGFELTRKRPEGFVKALLLHGG
jgi:threonine dehydrogenase-like Zn-dependent dehydrogenase